MSAVDNKSNWKRALRASVAEPRALLDRLNLGSEWLTSATAGHRTFPIQVPPAYLARIRPGDPDDPLLRQVLPTQDEAAPVAGFDLDPVGDAASEVAPGVLHKYHGRVLLIAAGKCAINCRYCFRRHFPYSRTNAAHGHWREALAYIADHSSIREVILSGGDPLLLGTAKLHRLSEGLQPIAHVQTLRIHSRVPVVLPERIDAEFCQWWHALPWQKVLVLHTNHAHEIDAQVAAVLQALNGPRTTLLNQAVLLRGVNDTAERLVALSERLFSVGVLPYYLHCLDRVQGAAHFEVPETSTRALMHAIRCRLPGYLVPRLVREVAGTPYKLPVL